MCRSIKQLRQPDQPPTEAEMHAAALQFVRKISGYRTPSRANQAAFDAAVSDIAAVTQRLLKELTPPRQAHAQGAPAGQQHAALDVAAGAGQPHEP